MSDEASQGGVPYQIPQHMIGSNILYMTNPQQELYKLELGYRGKMEDSEGNIVPVGPPLLNDKGINTVLGLLRSVVNQVNIMGNLGKNDIPELMNFFSDALIKNLMMTRKEYDMTEMARDQVFVSATNLAYFTMRRAMEEGDRRFWKGSVQEIRSTIDSTSKSKNGMLSGMLGWGKKNN